MAGNAPTRDPDALREYARRLDEWVDAHLMMHSGIGFLVGGANAGFVLVLVMFVFEVLEED